VVIGNAWISWQHMAGVGNMLFIILVVLRRITTVFIMMVVIIVVVIIVMVTVVGVSVEEIHQETQRLSSFCGRVFACVISTMTGGFVVWVCGVKA